MNLESWKTVAALWGALTGTLGTTIGLIAFFRDRSRLRVIVTVLARKDASKINEGFNSLGSAKFAFVEVVNVGRRIRHIYQPELWVASDHLLIPEQVDFVLLRNEWSKPDQPWQSWRLEEGEAATFVFGLAEKYVIVRADVPDSLARTRKTYFAPARSRFRWYYGRWKGGRMWKHMRDVGVDRTRTRHHKSD